MAKKILGVDIGHDQMKLALVKDGQVLKTVSCQMPENLLKEGRIASPETMGELIRTTIKENKLRANYAAFVLPSSTVYVKNVEMPVMTVDQLKYNLPFEFNDYITGELKDYVFDYAVVDSEGSEGSSGENTGSSSEEQEGETMELMAVGSPRAVLEDAQTVLRKAGLRLKIAAPGVCAYIALLRARQNSLEGTGQEYGILDLGFQEIRMYMFRKDRHVATRVLETGLSLQDNVLADAYSVDIHLAHTYLMTNFENCQQREECLAAYENIAVDLMRALNFYRFSNPDSVLSDFWLCGGGAMITPLAETIGDMLGIMLHSADELIEGGESIEECNTFVQAIGVTMI